MEEAMEKKQSQSRIVIDRIDRKIQLSRDKVKEHTIDAANFRNQYESYAIQVESLLSIESPTAEEKAELKEKKAGMEEAHNALVESNARREECALDIRRYQTMHDWLVSNNLRSIPRRLHDSLLAADDRTISNPVLLGEYIGKALEADVAISPEPVEPIPAEPAPAEPVPVEEEPVSEPEAEPASEPVVEQVVEVPAEEPEEEPKRRGLGLGSVASVLVPLALALALAATILICSH